MLKSIDPILNADVLYALRAMGHGDDLVLCDTNFPADAVARQTVLGRLLRIDNVTAARAARAVLSVLPLDSFVEKPASRMEIVGQPDEIPPVQLDVQKELQRRAEKLYGLIAEQSRTGHELAQAIWGDVAVTQAFLTLSEVIGHVDLLINAGHVREVNADGVVRYETTAETPAGELGDLIPGGNPAAEGS